MAGMNPTRAELKLAAHLLGMASERFSNDRCSDFDISPFMNVEERVEFDREAEEWNSGGEDFDEEDARDPYYMGYWWAMSALAHRFKVLAK